MGLRSWITIVSSREQLLETIDFAKNKAYGVSYVLQITREDAPLPKGTVIVAWSGDGDRSKEELMVQVDIFWDDVILLEDFLDSFSSIDWHGGENGPGKYGVFLTEEECNTVEIIGVPVSFYVSEYYELDIGTLGKKIESDDLYLEKHFFRKTLEIEDFYGSFWRLCENLYDLNRDFYFKIEDGSLAPKPDVQYGDFVVVAQLEVPQTKYSNKVTIRPDLLASGYLSIYYSINIHEILEVQSWELARAFLDKQLESWQQTTQELFGASEIIIPWRTDVVYNGYDFEGVQTINFLHITIGVNFNSLYNDFNQSIQISDIQNNLKELEGILDIGSKSRKELSKIKEDQADTLINISFCDCYMYYELFNKTFSTATPVYAIVDNWWHEERIYKKMCICIPPKSSYAKKYDMVTIQGDDLDQEELEFCYNFNIDGLYSDDENKQEELVKKFETALMSNKKQLESILRLDNWVKYHSGNPNNDQKTLTRTYDDEDKLWFCITTSSIRIEDLSQSLRTVDLLNNWEKIKEIVEITLKKILDKR
jgi:hypothetical protein